MQDWFTPDQNTCNSQRDCERVCLGFCSAAPRLSCNTRGKLEDATTAQAVGCSKVGLVWKGRGQGLKGLKRSASIRQLEAAGELH